MVCSIFMASMTSSGWPFSTVSPALTAMEMILPGMGAVRPPPCSPCVSCECASGSYSSSACEPASVKT